MAKKLQRPKKTFFDHMIKVVKKQISDNKKEKKILDKECAKLDREYVILQGQLKKWSDIKSGQSI